MQKILILTGRYLPGYKDGGPVRSIVNLVNIFGKEMDINIVCLDRDHGDTVPYEGINIGAMNRVGDANVYYAKESDYNAELIERLAKDVDIIYCCGPYNSYARAVMNLNRHHKLTCPLVVASMGSFSPKALAIKGYKKRLYIGVMKAMGMFENITWSVTSKREEQELKAAIGDKAKVMIAEDLPRLDSCPHEKKKEKGHIDIIFLSRISRKKNLLFAAKILSELPKEVDCTWDIYGIMEDRDYFRECEEVLETLPSNVRFRYMGETASEDVMKIMADYDAFLFPTMGENYGHVIAEAMAAGTIPIISDQTPWMDIEENEAGFVCSLDDINEFLQAIVTLSGENEETYRKRVNSTKQYIAEHNRESIEHSGYRKIFDIK